MAKPQKTSKIPTTFDHKVSWRSFGLKERRLIEDHGDFVEFADFLEPNEDGPYLIKYINSDNPPTWAVHTVYESK